MKQILNAINGASKSGGPGSPAWGNEESGLGSAKNESRVYFSFRLGTLFFVEFIRLGIDLGFISI